MAEGVTTAERGYDSRWQKARVAHLAEHPWCAFHLKQGQLIPATVVDHIKPHKLGDAIASGDAEAIAAARSLFWNRKNWQSLCKHCHDSVKQAMEQSGMVRGCGLDGVPIDDNHHWNRARSA